MRKLLIFIVTLFLVHVYLNAQDSTSVDTTGPKSPWKKGGITTLTFSQSYFDNWVAGGENLLAVNGRVSLFANYKKNNWSWDNSLDMAYGQTKQGELDWRKNDDLFDLNTKIGYKASKVWYVSGLLQLKTQFSNGYDYSDSIPPITSKFLNPAYINFGVGMDYKPNDDLSVYISPVNSKMTYVSDTVFSRDYSIEPGKNLKYDFGLYIKTKYQRDLTKTINLLTKLDLFANYGDLAFDKIDVNWEVLLTMQVWKAIAINVNTNLLYDNDIVRINETTGAEETFWQFKEVLGIGLTYKF